MTNLTNTPIQILYRRQTDRYGQVGSLSNNKGYMELILNSKYERGTDGRFKKKGTVIQKGTHKVKQIVKKVVNV